VDFSEIRGAFDGEGVLVSEEVCLVELMERALQFKGEIDF
jgi:hypothetical protein